MLRSAAPRFDRLSIVGMAVDAIDWWPIEACAFTMPRGRAEDPKFPNWSDPNDFRPWVRRAVRIRSYDRLDSSLDPWGTPLQAQLVRNILTIRSGGADKRFQTGDDVVSSQNIFDF